MSENSDFPAWWRACDKRAVVSQWATAALGCNHVASSPDCINEFPLTRFDPFGPLD